MIKKTAKESLSPAVKHRIKIKFSESHAKFSRLDFVDLAKYHGFQIGSVSKILAYMEEKGEIVQVGSVPTSGGGWNIKTYEVVNPDRFNSVRSEKEQELFNSDCAARLMSAMNMSLKKGMGENYEN